MYVDAHPYTGPAGADAEAECWNTAGCGGGGACCNGAGGAPYPAPNGTQINTEMVSLLSS